ncbi:MAG: DUF1152 domain-containing protein [Myxococcaceae bacterium]
MLVAGAGGGFDVFCGLPLALQLVEAGKQVCFANLSFTYLGGTDAELLAPALYRVTAETQGERYCPERSLARWLVARGLAGEVFAFEKTGVQPLSAAYQTLQQRLGFDAVVLVDGGTDILMRGDEAGLGTPEEDMTSLAAVASLGLPKSVVVCLGFGIDAFHGVCHAHFLENVAALEREGGYLGAFSVSRHTPEGAGFLDAVAQAQADHPNRASIVNGSIAAAVRGEFGNAQFTSRTQDSELFINPLMGLYFTFDLPSVVSRSLYLESLAETQTIFEVSARIEAFRHQVKQRPYRGIPG